MNTVKRWLAGFLSFAMIFTSASFTQLGNVGVFAAENYYNPVIKHGSTTLNSGYDGRPYEQFDGKYYTEGQFGETVTLSASTTTTSKKAVTGQTVYEWTVEENAGNRWEIAKDSFGQEITGKANSISFELSRRRPDIDYRVRLHMIQNYSLDGAFSTEDLGELAIYVDSFRKKIASSDVTIPKLNKAIKPYGSSGNDYGTDKNGDFVSLGYVADQIIASDAYNPTTKAGWEIDTAKTSLDTKLYVGKPVNVAFKFIVDTSSDRYEVSDPANWDGGISITKTVAVTAEASRQYVDTVDMDYVGEDWDLYYNPSLDKNKLKNLNSSQVEVDFTVHKENVNDATTVEPAFKSDDDSALSYSYDAKKGILNVNAIGIPKRADGRVRITAYDPEGTGDKDYIDFWITKAVVLDDIDFATVDPTFTYREGARVKDILDIDTLNATEASLPTAEQEHITYTVALYDRNRDDFSIRTADPIAVGDRYDFFGTYTLQANEWFVEEKNGVYIESDYNPNIGRKLLNRVEVVAPEITKEYVEEAIASIKYGGVALNGGTFGYGMDLGNDNKLPHQKGDKRRYLETEYAGLNLSIVKVKTKTQIKAGDEEIPDIGVHSTDYVIRVESSDATTYPIPADVKGEYPISFTVTEATLATVAGKDAGSASADDTYIYDETVTSLYAFCDPSYAEADDDYNFTWQWYRDGKPVGDSGEYRTAYLTANDLGESKLSGAFYCKFTATEITNRHGVLGETVVNSPVVTIGKQEIRVYDLDGRHTEIKYNEPRTYVDLEQSYVTTDTNNFTVEATDWTIGAITLSVKDADGKVVDTQTFDGAKNYKTIAYETPEKLSVGYYSVWIETTATKTGAAGASSTSYNAQIARLIVNPANPSQYMSNIDNYKEKDGKTAITYGELPNDVLNYEYAVSDNSIPVAVKGRINELVNANYKVTVVTNDNTISDVGTKEVHLIATPIAIGFDKTNTGINRPYAIQTIEAKILTVNKKKVNLYPDSESFTWVLGEESPLKASYKDEEFVGKDTAASLKFGYTYDILKDKKVVKDAEISAGEYTVQFKATGAENGNYEVVEPAPVALTVITADQKAAQEFAEAVAKADLTKKEEVEALMEAYEKLSKEAKALAEDAYKQVTEAKADIDAVEAAQALVAKAIAEGATDEDIKAAQDALAKLTDNQKKIYGEEALKKATEDVTKAAEAAEARKKADEDAKKAAEELAQAKAAANTAIAGAKGYESDANIKALIDALNAAIAKGDTAAIKAATTKLNDAVAAKKAAPAPVVKKAPKITFKTKSPKKIKASKLKKKAQTFKIKASADSKGTITYKKAKGSSKKVKISKKGKVTVKKGTKKGTYKLKVKATAAAKGNFKSGSKTKTYKIVVK